MLAVIRECLDVFKDYMFFTNQFFRFTLKHKIDSASPGDNFHLKSNSIIY